MDPACISSNIFVYLRSACISFDTESICETHNGGTPKRLQYCSVACVCISSAQPYDTGIMKFPAHSQFAVEQLWW